MFHVPNQHRVRVGKYASDDTSGNNGAFRVPISTRYAIIIASDGEGWEHVSVSLSDRCPTWDEMCRVKEMFWDDEDYAVQYHPPRSEYVNNYYYCLHLWRPTDQDIPRPASYLVGMRSFKDIASKEK